MGVRSMISAAVLLSSGVVLPSLSSHPIHAADQFVEATVVRAPIEALGAMAAGAVEDTRIR